MLRSVWGKTLFEKRWMILFWTLGVFVMNLFMLQIFPPMKEAFANMTQNLPPSLEVWFGGGEVWSSLSGFVDLEIMGQMTTVMIVFAIIFGLSVLASEESSGMLLTQLSKPVGRSQFYWQKFLAFMTATLVVMLGFWLGTWLGTVVLGQTIPLGELLPPMIAVVLVTALFGGLAFAISAATGSKALAGVVSSCYAIFGYFITSLRGTADILVTLGQSTPFYYYNNPSVLENGLDLNNVLVLLAGIVVPLILAALVFGRRDFKTR